MKTCRGLFTGSPSAHNSPADHIPYFPPRAVKNHCIFGAGGYNGGARSCEASRRDPRINRYGMEKNNV